MSQCVALSGKSMKGALEIPIGTMSQKQDLQLDFNQIVLKSITKDLKITQFKISFSITLLRILYALQNLLDSFLPGRVFKIDEDAGWI